MGMPAGLIAGDVVGGWGSACVRPNRDAVYCARLGERAVDVGGSRHDIPPHCDPANQDHPRGGPGNQVCIRYFHKIANAMHTQ
jgi:hypothetical protein